MRRLPLVRHWSLVRDNANSKLVIMNKGNEMYKVSDSQYHETEFEQ